VSPEVRRESVEVDTLVKRTRYGSYLVGDLPEGCRLCTMGAKLVLFVTGLCGRRCFYCPLSPQRKGRDMPYANERPVRRRSDILEEAHLMDALGTGMTGGDPLAKPSRALRFLSLMKSEFGTEHHVHLYTAHSRVGSAFLASLKRHGLDELRFHATRAHRGSILRATGMGITAGVEIPAMPGRVERMKAIASMADSVGCSFLNLNELEMCESTAQGFAERGLRLVNDESMAVMGSIEAALEVAEFCEDNTSLNVHVCPSRLKDAVQLRNRLGRMARGVKRPYEYIDEDNLLVKTTLSPRVPMSGREMEGLAERLRKDLSINSSLLAYSPRRNRIETLPSLGKRIARLVDAGKIEVALTEEYPTWDRLQTEKRLLSQSGGWKG